MHSSAGWYESFKDKVVSVSDLAIAWFGGRVSPVIITIRLSPRKKEAKSNGTTPMTKAFSYMKLMESIYRRRTRGDLRQWGQSDINLSKRINQREFSEDARVSSISTKCPAILLSTRHTIIVARDGDWADGRFRGYCSAAAGCNICGSLNFNNDDCHVQLNYCAACHATYPEGDEAKRVGDGMFVAAAYWFWWLG